MKKHCVRERLAIVGFVVAVLFCAFSRAEAQEKVITWGGNSPEWNKKLHVSALRIGCSDAPPSCLKSAERIASEQGVRSIFLAILLKNPRTLADAVQYSQLSSGNPMIVEVGIDDFVSQAGKLGMKGEALSSFLSSVIQALKHDNPQLKFGITVYEDQLDGEVPKLGLSSDVRGAIDYVHLFTHYRRESAPFGDYVSRAKSTFPNAQIIGGVYAYDRREYLPCSKGGKECSNDEEQSLFANWLKQQVAALRNGQIAWLEFYPGAFGQEEQWSGWRQPRFCSSSRIDECLANTRAMRREVLNELSSQ